MAANLNEAALELEQAIRQSDEFKQLKQAYLDVEADETARNMFEQFRQVQLNLQHKQMLGQEISQEEVEQVRNLVAYIQQNVKISRLMQAEQRLGLIIGNLNMVIMKPVEELYGIPQP